jgi:hypothetical protein
VLVGRKRAVREMWTNFLTVDAMKKITFDMWQSLIKVSDCIKNSVNVYVDVKMVTSLAVCNTFKHEKRENFSAY